MRETAKKVLAVDPYMQIQKKVVINARNRNTKFF